MNVKNQRRIAASILKVGQGRVWFDSEDAEAIEAAVTREDIRKLIHAGAIQARQEKGVSRYRARKAYLQRKKGRRTGKGKHRGTKFARQPRKRRWISTIRPIRQRLAELRNSKKIDSKTYRRLYLMAKGGAFRSKSHLEAQVKEWKR